MAPPSKPTGSKMARVRNIGIVAHIDAGKTTVTERFLFYSRTHPQDRRGPRGRGADGLDAAGARARHHHHRRGDQLHLAQPRHPPHRHARPRRLHHRGRAHRCACSTARWWCSTASSGVEPQSETVWRQADKFHVPRIAFINKMDRAGADFGAAVDRDPRAARRAARCRSSCRSAPRTSSPASSI